MTENQDQKTYMIGIGAAFISALLFGIAPSIAKLAYDGGSNGITLTFTTSILSLPILFLIAKLGKISLKLKKSEMLVVILVNIFGGFLTGFMLNSSYSHINVGMATILHYFFPVFVMLVSIIIFKEKTKWWKISALVLGFAGVIAFTSTATQGDSTGVWLAIGSAVCYATVLISIERTVLSTFHSVKLAFYTSLISAISSFIVGQARGTLVLNMTSTAWSYSFFQALMVGVAGGILLNYAVLRVGASTTSVVSMMEPLSGVFFGYLILKETFTAMNWIGSVLIMTGVAIISIFSYRESVNRKNSFKATEAQRTETG